MVCVIYNNVNAGNQAAIQIVGKNAYYGKMSLKFTIKQYSLTSNCKISDVQNQSYTGYAITPKISVMCGNRTLKENTDYTVEYSNNKEAGDSRDQNLLLFSASIHGKKEYYYNRKKKDS